MVYPSPKFLPLSRLVLIKYTRYNPVDICRAHPKMRQISTCGVSTVQSSPFLFIKLRLPRCISVRVDSASKCVRVLIWLLLRLCFFLRPIMFQVHNYIIYISSLLLPFLLYYTTMGSYEYSNQLLHPCIDDYLVVTYVHRHGYSSLLDP